MCLSPHLILQVEDVELIVGLFLRVVKSSRDFGIVLEQPRGY
jgi:hypothetical protein